jgi:nucleotide-binding universal stress UspA family protein
MTTSHTPPFAHLLVPYDGSEPARAALCYALAIAHGDARITVVTVVDQTAVMAKTSAALAVYDWFARASCRCWSSRSADQRNVQRSTTARRSASFTGFAR